MYIKTLNTQPLSKIRFANINHYFQTLTNSLHVCFSQSYIVTDFVNLTCSF